MARDLPSEQPAAASALSLARPEPAPATPYPAAPYDQGSDAPSYTAVFYLTAAFLFIATLLRSVLILEDGVLMRALVSLGAWLVLFGVAQLLTPRRPWLFVLYVPLQTALVVALLSLSDETDYFAALFAVLSMQVIQRWPLRQAVVCIVLFVPLTALGIYEEYGFPVTFVSALTFGAADAFAAIYAWSARTAGEERARTEALAGRLREVNHELQASSERVERLTIAKERSWIARELHDSVTQTIFAMTLAARSLLLLPGDDRERVRGQLDRLAALADAALSEMRVLIAELRPETATEGGLVVALRRHLAGRTSADGLAVTLEVEGEERLTATEEQGLFRIAQEALNNVAKHAGTAEAHVRLELREPFRLEVRDQGRGFDQDGARDGTGMGLGGMRERAAEIGWTLEIVSAPGEGTVVRAQRDAEARRTP